MAMRKAVNTASFRDGDAAAADRVPAALLDRARLRLRVPALVHLSEKGLRLAQKMPVGPCSAVEI